MNKLYRILKILTAALLCAGVFAGCTEQPASDKKKIVTSFYPVYIFTANLTRGIDEIEVENMTEQNSGCLHDYQLLSGDMKMLGDASALVINGAGMESFLDKITEQLPDLEVIDASQNVELLEEEHCHEEHDHEHEGHHHGANAHVWLSVPNAISEVEHIAEELRRIFPQHESAIVENRDDYIKRLERTDNEIREILAPVKGAKVLSFHEAYDYFAEEYGIVISGAIEADDGGEPGTRELIETVELIRSENIKALFTEPNYKGSAAGILSRETGAGIYELNPVTSFSDKYDLSAYEEIMVENAKIIRKAVS